MNFNVATAKDIKLIQELARESWENAYAEILSKEQIEYMLSEMYSTEEISSHLENPNYNYFLIENEGEKIGFIGFEKHYEDNTTKLHRIYLLPEAKGKGVGKAAVNFMKDQVKNAGDHRIILNVNKDNVARKIYEAMGFNVYAEGVFDIGEGYVMDDYLMEYRF